MTKKLHSLNFTRLTYPETAQFVGRTIEDIEQSGLRLNTDESLAPLLNQCKTVLATFKASIKQVRASDKTVSLAKLDRERDEDFKALLSALKAFRTSKREPEQKAYTSLDLLTKTYRKSSDKHYEAQTLLFANFLDKLATAPYKEQVRLLGLQRFVDNLAESNTAFNALYVSRSKEKLTKVAEKTSDLKDQLIFNYNLLADYINIMAQVKKTKLYTDLLTIINHDRKTYADLIARKPKTKKDKDKEKDQDKA